MNVTEYTYLINRPNAVNHYQVNALELLLENFPYFQSAISMHLKGLYVQDSFKYNQALKKAAAYTSDRSVLFDFITSENFIPIQKKIFEELETKTLSIEVVDSQVVQDKNVITNNTLEKSILSSIQTANENLDEKKETIEAEITELKENEILNVEQKLESGKPLPFNSNETHSFNEWLQISKIKPIVRDVIVEEIKIVENNLTSKLSTIDKFIEANPKIKPVEKESEFTSITIKSEETSYLMTETLARVYLEQKKYGKAMQAYQILILKYPEKSSFFADRISDIKKLQ